MDHKKEDELELEEILREFSEEPELEEILREFSPRKSQPVSTDTIRMDPVKIYSPRDLNAQTIRFQAADGPDEPPPPPPPPLPPEEPAVEPFSEEWEPEYDEPMGQYIPKEPIPFRPKDRSRILREKLVNGPEKRYYELSSAGLAGLRLSALLSLVVFFASASITWAYSAEMIAPQRLKFVVFCQLLAVLLAALLGRNRLLDGFATLIKGRFTLHSMLLLTGIVCCADSVLCLSQERISCCSIFCLQVALAQWAATEDRFTELCQMDTLRRAPDLTALVKTEDFQDGITGYTTRPGEPEDFLDHYRTPSGPERSVHIFAAASVLLSIALAVVAGLSGGLTAGMQVLTAAMLASTPATAFISMRRPEAVLQKRLHALGTVLCGWQGVKAVDKTIRFPVTHRDLFPGDSVRMNGMKFYGSIDPDMVLCYTGSLIAHEGGSLTAVFDPLMARRYIRHARVEEFSSYPGGLSALVDGEPVAVGTLEFMHQMDIEIPQETRIRQAIYAVVDGQLSGVFAVNYSRSKAAAAGLRNLCSYRKLKPILVSGDFLITDRFLRDTLKVNAKHMIFPDRDTQIALSETQAAPGAPVVALTIREGLPQRAMAVTGAWALGSAQRLGAVIHILGGVLGLAAVAVLAYVGALHLLMPINLLLYSLVWMIPGFLITEWTRYI